MNPDVLKQMLRTTREMTTKLKRDFRIRTFDTSSRALSGKPKETSELVADFVLDVIEEQLREDVFCLPTESLKNLFGEMSCLVGADSLRVWDSFAKQGLFVPREDAEKQSKLVQALPVVVVRTKSGDVLRLRRREAHESNPLDQKIVIWAGGHVRSEDDDNGKVILKAALRELQEELRLSVEADELSVLGCVYVGTGERTSKHVALVYEWRADTDDVAIVLCSTEFFERHGNSLSGTFVTIDQLANDVLDKEITEPWSVEIARSLLAPAKFPARLF
jgi:predicted NUDIX family phosphoesterase